MKIKDILSMQRSFSFEVFPPKSHMPLQPLFPVVDSLSALKPSFISITCGAMGSTEGHTVAGAAYIQKAGCTAMAHLTCVSLDQESLAEKLGRFQELGIENILALRGDIPDGGRSSTSYPYASCLIEALKKYKGFCIGAACYPETHPESISPKKDIDCLKEKADKGADFFVSQLFFDNNIFFQFLGKLRDAGVGLPVIAGIMPPLKAAQITKMCALSQASLPQGLKNLLHRYALDDASMQAAGLDFSARQIEGLLQNGVEGIHLYTMNQPKTAQEILTEIGGACGT